MDGNDTLKTRLQRQRGILLTIVAIIFGLAGLVLFIIVYYSTEEATRKFAYDLLKVWMGALIGIVSSMGTYYFTGED